MTPKEQPAAGSGTQKGPKPAPQGAGTPVLFKDLASI